MTKKMLAVLAAATTLALPASALAGGMDVTLDSRTGLETRSQTVSLTDLDLASRHGMRIADSRINRAAKQVCGWKRGSIQQPTREYRACLNEALDSAGADVARGQRQG